MGDDVILRMADSCHEVRALHHGLTRPLATAISPRPNMDLRAVRGMNDILPEEIARWHRLEAIFRARAELHGYGEIRTTAPRIDRTLREGGR